MNAINLLNYAIEDFESFFTNDYKVSVQHEVGRFLCVSGKEGNATIQIPAYFSTKPIESDIDKLYLLFLIGHEIAHYINKHHTHIDFDYSETSALEAWADYFGSIVSMSVLTIGTKFSKYIECDICDRDDTILIIISTLERLYEEFKATDTISKYDKSEERLATMISGVTSFLVRRALILSGNVNTEEQYLQISMNWSYTIAKLTAEDSSLNEAYSLLETNGLLEKLKKKITLINKIHLKLLGHEKEITAGVHPLMKMILGTDFQRPDIQKTAFLYVNKIFNDA